MSDFDKSSESEKKVDVVGVAEFPSDAESLAAPPARGELKRQLKNRHIAMIRCAALPAVMSSALLTPCFQYRRCHRYRIILGDSDLLEAWWPYWPASGLQYRRLDHIRGHDLVGRDGCLSAD